MADLRKLKDEAIEAAANGNWKRAATLYAQLEQADRDPLWPLKLGECLRRLGSKDEAIKALSRAVDVYAEGQLLLKAIAVCKIILDLDPCHTKTQQRLAALASRQETSTWDDTSAPEPVAPSLEPPTESRQAWAPVAHVRGRAPRRPDRPSDAQITPAPALAPLVPQPSEPQVPPAVLQTIRLSEVFPSARPSTALPAECGAAIEIPIDLMTPPPATNVGLRPGRRTIARAVLPKTPFFTVLTTDQLRMAIERVQLIELDAGEILFAMGDPGDVLYVVASGEIVVLVPQEVARLQEGDFFGEIALLGNQPRTATTRASMPSQVLALDRALMRDLVVGSPALLKVLLRFVRERLISTLAQTSPLFAPFDDAERAMLTSKFRFLEVDEKVLLLEEGKKSPGLFVLLTGEAAAVVDGKPVAHYQAGDLFGEISLIAGTQATATVVTLARCFLLHMSRSDFTEIIMTHPQVLEYLGTLAHDRLQETGRLKLF